MVDRRTILTAVVIVLGIYAGYLVAIDPITWDSVVAVGLFLVAVLSSAILLIFRKARSPFNMWYLPEIPEIQEFPPSGARRLKREKKVSISTGEHTLYFLIQPKSGLYFDEVDIRCVERYLTWRWKGWRPRIWDFRLVPTAIIEIKEFQEAELERQRGVAAHRFQRRTAVA
ncbi:MAG: hypothetical protein AAB303_05795, partial [Chloroflexota bacterium]